MILIPEILPDLRLVQLNQKKKIKIRQRKNQKMQ